MAVPSTSILGASSRRRNSVDSLATIAYRRIKTRIVTLELAPASVIDEATLAAELELGLTPIRQALRRLAYENLIIILPRRGTIVADLNLSDLHKIFEMRIELEALAARLATERAQPFHIGCLQDLRRETEQLLAEDDNRRLIELDYRFHAAIWQAAGNEFLEETLERLYTHVLRLWNMSLERVVGLQQAMREHSELADAIAAGNAVQAEEAMRAHVAHFQHEMATLLQ